MEFRGLKIGCSEDGIRSVEGSGFIDYKSKYQMLKIRIVSRRIRRVLRDAVFKDRGATCSSGIAKLDAELKENEIELKISLISEPL